MLVYAYLLAVRRMDKCGRGRSDVGPCALDEKAIARMANFERFGTECKLRFSWFLPNDERRSLDCGDLTSNHRRSKSSDACYCKSILDRMGCITGYRVVVEPPHSVASRPTKRSSASIPPKNGSANMALFRGVCHCRRQLVATG